MRLRHLLLLSAALGACSGGEDAGPTGPFSVTPAHVWASQSVTVAGGGLDPHATDAWLEVDTLHLTLADNGAGALATTLPSWLNGAFSPVLHAGTQSFPLDNITVYGYVESATYPDVGLWGPPQIWKGAGVASLLGTTYPGGVAIFDLDNRRVERLTGVNRWGELNRQPGPTVTPGIWLFASDTGTNLEAWALEPTPHRVAEYPVQALRNAMLFGDDRWWRSSHHWLHLPDGELEQAEGTQIALMSPRGDRATLLVNNMDQTAGIPVYDVTSGEAVWRAPFTRARAAAFSPDGELVVMVGAYAPQTITESRVVLFRADDGSIVRDTVFADAIGAAAFDPVRPYIYVAAAVVDSGDYAHPEILVLDRETLTPQARLGIPAPVVSRSGCCQFASLTTSAITSRLHAFWQPGPDPIIDWIFALPPH